MRSNRSHIDHENRRHNYHYHSSNRGQSNHSESNGHNATINNIDQYRSSKRSNMNSGNTNLIKRMKSTPSPNDNAHSTRDFVNVKTPKSSTVHNLTTNSIKIDSNECHQITLNGYIQEEINALSAPSLDQKAVDDFIKFKNVSSNLKELIKMILENKKLKCQQKNENSSSKSMDETLSDIKVKGLMCLIEMKNINRLDKYRLKESRKKISSGKDKVDQIHLQLQNIQYEVMHLQKEQKTCASFRSKDESLDLVEENKFFISNEFPEELKHLLIETDDSVNLNKDITTSEDHHKLHLSRLDWELKQRISAEDQLKMSEESRSKLEIEIASKKQTLSQFDPILKNIIDAAKPLVSKLNVPLQVYDSSNLLTPFLPKPLYVLYVQLQAFKSAFNLNYDITIQGTIDEAQEFQSKQKNETNLLSLMNSFQKKLNDDENYIGSQQLEDDDDELEHRKKSKKSRHYHSKRHGVSDDSNVNEKNLNVENSKSDFHNKYNKLLTFHPIKISINFDYRNFKIICTFTYFTKLELVGLTYKIDCLSSSNTTNETKFSVINFESNIFSKLLSSNDTGLKCPNAKIEYLLNCFGIIPPYADLIKEIGYTYDWAQRISGIEYLNFDENPTLSNSCGILRVESSVAMDCLDKTIKTMMYRFQSRIDLQKQIDYICLNKNIDINSFECSNNLDIEKNLSSLKPKCFIQSFEKITGDELINELDSNQKKNLIEYFEIDMDNNINSFCNDLFDQNNFFFKLILLYDQKSDYLYDEKLNAYIIIPQNYPRQWPFFTLNLISTSSFFLYPNWIRNLEEHINVNLAENLMKQKNLKNSDEEYYSKILLLKQIYSLQCGLDKILDQYEKYQQQQTMINDKTTETYFFKSKNLNENNFKSTTTTTTWSELSFHL